MDIIVEESFSNRNWTEKKYSVMGLRTIQLDVVVVGSLEEPVEKSGMTAGRM